MYAIRSYYVTGASSGIGEAAALAFAREGAKLLLGARRVERLQAVAEAALKAGAAFVSAFAVVRWLIRYVANHDFRPFAWYRIAFGVIVLATAYGGWVDWGLG